MSQSGQRESMVWVTVQPTQQLTHDTHYSIIKIRTTTMAKSAWELCFGCMLRLSRDGRRCVSFWEHRVSVMVLVWQWACIVLLSEGLTAALCASNMRSDSLTTIANDRSVVLSCPNALCVGQTHGLCFCYPIFSAEPLDNYWWSENKG